MDTENSTTPTLLTFVPETDHLNGILFTDFVNQAEMLPYQEYIKLIQN